MQNLIWFIRMKIFSLMSLIDTYIHVVTSLEVTGWLVCGQVTNAVPFLTTCY